MYPNQGSKKKSDFIGDNIIPENAMLDFFSSAGNFRISKADFLGALGVSGTVSGIGDPAGTAIYNQNGTDNQIRSLLAGAGIKTSISPLGSAEIGHNFISGGDGVDILGNPTSLSPVIRSIKGDGGISVSLSGDAVVIDGGTNGLAKRVIVGQASDLAGTLDSANEYFIDGVINMGAQSISVPAGGLNLTGYNFNASKLISSASNYTMFTSPVGGSGSIIGKDYALEVTGTNSQVYDIESATGFDAFEFSRINYNNCTSRGTITGYRQGLEVGTGYFGGKPELTLAGTWVGGYFIDTSIVRSLDDGAYSLFKAGAGFSMASRFRSNQNIDLPANVSFFDFAPANFTNSSTVQMDGVIITRGGVFDSTDSNITPNMSASDLVCNWSNNNGMPNTFEGGAIGVTTEAVTTITVAGTFVDIAAASWTVADLQHFDSPADGQLRHLGSTPREYRVVASFLLDSNSGDEITLRVTKWDDSASTFVTVLDQTREVNNFQGGRDVAFFTVNINATLDTNDYIKLQTANLLATNNITAEMDSYYTIEAR